MSMGFVSILLCSSVIQSIGGVSWFLNTILSNFLGFFSYICLYLDMVFLIQSCVYFVVILRAWVFAVLAILAIVTIHSCWQAT